MAFVFSPVPDVGLDRTADVLTRAFADYYGAPPFTAAGLLQLARTDSVDLAASRVIARDGEPIGAALVARRGWTSRLAAMAIVPASRRGGAGRAMIGQLLSEARARGERSMVLEVIAENEPAVRLYEAAGFRRVRRLLSFEGPETAAAPAAALEEVDPRALAAAVTREGLPDLPWQLSGETLAHLDPPAVAYRLDGAWIALTGVARETVTIRALLVESHRRGAGRGLALVRAAMARHPGRRWRVPALWPEELAAVFNRAGLGRAALSQWQMEHLLPA